MAKDSDHGVVQIEDQTRAVVGQVNEMLQQSIIKATKLLPEAGRSVEQETAQGLRIGKARQTREVLEGVVATQE